MRLVTRPIGWLAVCSGVPALLSLLAGCGGFAFYESSKVGIGITVDPKAPDPVAISAAFKEEVYALLPVGQDKTSPDITRIVVGPVLSDFDVRYGVNAGVNTPNQDFLYAAITHGIATGTAANTLALRHTSADQARRVVITTFLRQLSTDDLKKTADELKLSGLGTPDVPEMRRRSVEAVEMSTSGDLTVIEQMLEAKFPSFTPWTQ